jgi:hypothetical protein
MNVVAFSSGIDLDPLEYLAANAGRESHFVHSSAESEILSYAILGLEVGPESISATIRSWPSLMDQADDAKLVDPSTEGREDKRESLDQSP